MVVAWHLEGGPFLEALTGCLLAPTNLAPAEVRWSRLGHSRLYKLSREPCWRGNLHSPIRSGAPWGQPLLVVEASVFQSKSQLLGLFDAKTKWRSCAGRPRANYAELVNASEAQKKCPWVAKHGVEMTKSSLAAISYERCDNSGEKAAVAPRSRRLDKYVGRGERGWFSQTPSFSQPREWGDAPWDGIGRPGVSYSHHYGSSRTTAELARWADTGPTTV